MKVLLILPLTIVAALTPPEYSIEIRDENVEPVDLDTDADIIGISFTTALAVRSARCGLTGSSTATGETTVSVMSSCSRR